MWSKAQACVESGPALKLYYESYTVLSSDMDNAMELD